MILYHGSNVEIKEPIILIQDKGRDFGFGFYTTTIIEQAERWAKRTARIKSQANDANGTAVINVYKLNEEAFKLLDFKDFPNADLEWLDFVIKCRSNISYRHKYDIVAGKIANDNVGETIDFVVSGIMRKDDAIQRLRFEKVNDQICFCTEKALKFLNFERSIMVPDNANPRS